MSTAKKTASRKPTTVSSPSDFKKRQGGLMTLPSGLVMKLKNPGGLKIFLEQGSIPNSLMGIAQEALDKGKPANMRSVIGEDKMDDQMIDDMLKMMDTVVIQCAVEPKVHPTPTEDDLKVWNKGKAKTKQLSDPEDLKSDELVYADEIPEEDKMFIFQWVTGGTSDVAQFRERFTSELASLQ